MQLGLLNLILKLRSLTLADDGQDIVEYALIVALIATGCVASTSSFARLITTSFTSIATTFDSYA
jgi:pilus assembly protein Flp/PilA